MHRYLLALPLYLLALTASAAELHSDGTIDTRIGLSKKWDVVLHNRARVRASQNDWYDVSLVPIFRYRAHPNIRVSTGTFVTWIESASEWRSVVRPFVTVEPSIRQGKVTLASRTGYERFAVIDGANFNRYRQRFRVVGNGTWKPYAGTEFFFTNKGLVTTRYGAGVRRDINQRSGVEFSYWYEARDLVGAGVRHMLSVTFHLNFQGFAPDL